MTPPRNPLLAVLALALVTGAPAPALAEHTPGVPGWQQDVHYSISASYTPAKFEIAGRETLAYWNLSPDTLSELYFHLYLNAYRPGSHMARHDAYFEDWKIENLPSRRRGSETIDGVTLLRGDPLPVQVDDTIAGIALPSVLAPGESVIVCLAFRSVIPDVPERMGRSGKGIFAAQWFPKVCAYDRFGWHAEQHLGSEFYGDFGAYDVRITLPESFLLAHTGTGRGSRPPETARSRSGIEAALRLPAIRRAGARTSCRAPGWSTPTRSTISRGRATRSGSGGARGGTGSRSTRSTARGTPSAGTTWPGKARA